MLCCNHDTVHVDTLDAPYRRVLYIALAINFTMFVVEIVSGWVSGSMALRADALDFLSDSFTFVISLAVIGGSVLARTRASLFKGISLGAFGLWILGMTVWYAIYPNAPSGHVMGVVGFSALVANLFCAAMLYRFRNGDSNKRSVWLCSRNDAIGNILVMAAAALVITLQSPWPDLAVAFVMAGLSCHSSVEIIRHALAERSHA